VDELVVRMKDPGATDGPRLSTLLRRLLLPLEFVGVLPFGSTARPDGTDESPFGALWAAYQHYGNPTASLIDVTVEASPATGSRLPRVPAPGPRKEAEQEMRVHGGSIR
jgi:hypothetical protein